MPPDFLRLFRVRIGTLATGIKAVLAEEAFSASNRERHNDPVADLQFLVVFADFDHFAHCLMTEHIAAFHGRHDAVEEVEIRTADGTDRYSDDGVPVVLYLRVGNRFTSNVAFAVPSKGFHVRSTKEYLSRRVTKSS
jgi:hypothetical protein